MSDRKTALITGVNGQDGSYLAELLLNKGYFVVGVQRRSSSSCSARISHLLNHSDFCHRNCDLNDIYSINSIVREFEPTEVYNLAAQSHVAVSFEMPEYTTETICHGTLNIINSIRFLSPNSRFYQASSSEMFGDSKDYGVNGFTETSALKPVSPYAVSKSYAHYLTQMYRDAYSLHASSGILFNHESPRRGETFVTRKITMAVAKIKKGLQKKLILGNLDAKRDWGYAGDYVEAMWLMLQQPKGDDYVVATGKTHTVREFLEIVFDYAGLGSYEKYVEIDPKLLRPNEVPYLLGDATKARTVLNWKPKTSMLELAKMMYDSDLAAIRN